MCSRERVPSKHSARIDLSRYGEWARLGVRVLLNLPCNSRFEMPVSKVPRVTVDPQGALYTRSFGPFRLDLENQCLWRGETRISLMPKPFAVLRYLVEHPGRLVTHDQLLQAVWPDTYVQPELIRRYIVEIRRALGDRPEAGAARAGRGAAARGSRRDPRAHGVRELCEALEVITRTIPLVMFLEDLHWVDYSTLDVISAIARRRDPARLLVVGTFRPAVLARPIALDAGRRPPGGARVSAHPRSSGGRSFFTFPRGGVARSGARLRDGRRCAAQPRGIRELPGWMEAR